MKEQVDFTKNQRNCGVENNIVIEMKIHGSNQIWEVNENHHLLF